MAQVVINDSDQLYARARAIIPGGTQTISKRPERFVPDAWPAYWDRASGSRLWDTEGREYLDYVLALGPVLLGYNDPAVTAAVQRQLEKGPLTTLQSPLEVRIAEKLIEHIPCAEMARFFKTGAESTAAAVRVARAATGRETILSSGYGGCHDWWVAKMTDAAAKRGVPQCLDHLIHDVPLGDIATLRTLAGAYSDDLACIMIEPKAVPNLENFLRAAREVADSRGAVFVMDEIVTGFRMGLGGAQAYFGVTPHLATFGKAIANGFPLAALVGKRELMEIAAELWLTSTFGGEALSLAAADAVIHGLETTDVLAHVWAMGEQLQEGWRSLGLGKGRAQVYGLPPCPGLRFLDASGREDAQMDALYVERMLHEGILMRRAHCAFVSAAHTADDIGRTIESTAAVLRESFSGVS